MTDTIFDKHPVVAGITAIAGVTALICLAGIISDRFRINFLWTLGIVVLCWWTLSSCVNRLVHLIAGNLPRQPKPEQLQEALEASRKWAEEGQKLLRESRDRNEFKVGELEPDEEEFVRQQGLSRLTYIPRREIRAQRETLRQYSERMRWRAEIMSRPADDQERVRMEANERVRHVRAGLSERFDGFGYGMFLFVILAITSGIVASDGWGVGVLVCVLMLVILELSYQLYNVPTLNRLTPLRLPARWSLPCWAPWPNSKGR